MSGMHSIRLCVQSSKLEAALQSLADLAERFPDVVQRFLEGLFDFSELVRIHSIDGPAGATGEAWIAFEPSDRLLEFLAATAAGKFEGLAVDVEGHEHS